VSGVAAGFCVTGAGGVLVSLGVGVTVALFEAPAGGVTVVPPTIESCVFDDVEFAFTFEALEFELPALLPAALLELVGSTGEEIAGTGFETTPLPPVDVELSVAPLAGVFDGFASWCCTI